MTGSKKHWEEFRFIDLFAGIGGIRIPFEELGGKCVFSSEWDEAAQDSYEANFGERPEGDITQINEEAVPGHDILLGGLPCQAFSIMGNGRGFQDTRGTLFFDVERILTKKKPFAFLLENVKQLRTHDKGRTFRTIVEHLEALGYYVHTTVLNAHGFGVPQKRERTFFVGFRENLDFSFPEPLRTISNLGDILEPKEDIDPKLFASEKILRSRQEKLKADPFFPSMWHENKSGNVSVLPYSCALRAGASYSYLLVNGERRPSSRELLRLQGFPDSYKIVVPHSQIRKQTGNSVAVPVIRAIGRKMLDTLKSRKPAAPQYRQMSLLSERS